MGNLIFPRFGALALRDNAYEKGRVISVARSIREACGQTRRIPFDPEACAANFDIAVRLVDLSEEMAGRLVRFSWGYAMEVRQADSWHRRRFTMAHELAHLCFISRPPALPDEPKVIFGSAELDSREEQICNKIAAELLMPRRRFLSDARSLTPCFQSVLHLHNIFDVSASAILRRIKDLDVWSIATRIWKIDGETGVLKRITGSSVVRRRQRRTSLSSKAAYSNLTALLREAEMLLQDVNESEKILEEVRRGGYVVKPILRGEVTFRRQADGSLHGFVLA